MEYIWQHKDWPNFKFNLSNFDQQIQEVKILISENIGASRIISKEQRFESEVHSLLEEAIKSSQIEGEIFSREDVRSSIINHLNIQTNKHKISDIRADSIVSLLIDVKNTFDNELSKEVLFEWHKKLFSYVRQYNLEGQTIGKWRISEEPMRVISGSMNKIKIHFEAPPSEVVNKEMKKFIKWFNDSKQKALEDFNYGIIRVALSHLYFESIHPFEDGNGRIGRCLAEKALAQIITNPTYFCLSSALEKNKKKYYLELENAQKKNDTSKWISFFIKVIHDSLISVNKCYQFVNYKSKLFYKYEKTLSERQLKVIKKMIDKLPFEEFEGGMNARKYCSLTGISKATATRDLTELLQLGIFKQQGSGRSISYFINMEI